jgi:hypothetical protein
MELVGKKIIITDIRDNSVYFIHRLTNDKELVEKTDEYQLFYSKKYDFYICYVINTQPVQSFISFLKQISVSNYVHFIISDGGGHTNNLVINYIEKEMDFKNFDYSIVFNHNEVISNIQPFDIEQYKHIKYFFSSAKTINRKDYFYWPYKNPDKFIFDIKYGFLYSYQKFGFNNFLHIENDYENKNRKNKIFVYSKVGDRWGRINAVNRIKNIDRFYKKEFNEDDWFWYYTNYNQYHISFYTDYTTCKFNLIFETFDADFNDVLFASEKTCKGLMVNTPFYLHVADGIVNELHDDGFYTLNKNFENYEKFVTFMKNCSAEEFENLYLETKEKSKNNKKILEDYIYSDKIKEINLLINK